MSLQEQLYDWDNLCLAYANAARGKRGREAAAAFEFDLADQLLAIEHDLREKVYQPGAYRSFYIHEPKKRLISAAPFRDRVVHHALCNLTTPYFERLFIPNSYANRVDKGTHRALDCCQGYAKRYRYFLPCDIVQFFPSIDHEILRGVLQRLLPDDSLSWVIDCILASGQGTLAAEYDMVYFPGDDLFSIRRPRGLPIGNLTSQWWANCYLNPFDHFVRRELGCPAYLRYVDDFLLFGDDKKVLMNWRDAIVKRLERFRLTLHQGSAHPHPVTNGIPFLGFIVFPEHRRLKPRKGYAFRRKIRRLVQTADQKTVDASIRGWISHVSHGDTYQLRKEMLAEIGKLYV